MFYAPNIDTSSILIQPWQRFPILGMLHCTRHRRAISDVSRYRVANDQVRSERQSATQEDSPRIWKTTQDTFCRCRHIGVSGDTLEAVSPGDSVFKRVWWSSSRILLETSSVERFDKAGFFAQSSAIVTTGLQLSTMHSSGQTSCTIKVADSPRHSLLWRTQASTRRSSRRAGPRRARIQSSHRIGGDDRFPIGRKRTDLFHSRFLRVLQASSRLVIAWLAFACPLDS
jgi:hypothetical protein